MSATQRIINLVVKPPSPTSSDRRPDGRLKPPPNYFSRGVQTRLLVLVFSFMLVVVLMGEARKPENWRWMWAGEDGGAALTKPELADEEIDTRLKTSGAELAIDDAASPTISAQPDADGRPADEELAPSQTLEDAVQRELLDQWARKMEALNSNERDAVFQALKAARRETPLPEQDVRPLTSALDKLEVDWAEYFDDAFLAAAQHQSGLTVEQRKLWLDVLEETKTLWTSHWQPGLQSYLEDRPLLIDQRKSMEKLQQVLDEVALSEVRDNTVARSPEKRAWFRLLEKLQQATPEELATASPQRVGYLQIYKLPKDYRGELVSVRGTARLAYRVEAPPNRSGIDGYYIFWVKPAGGADSPIVVYSLETPPGFPKIKDRDKEKTTTNLNEEVEFTGYFFKRWAYRAQDGTRLAPLVLAKSPQWTPSTPAAGEESAPLSWIIMAACGSLAAGILFALLAYLRSSWPSAASRGLASGRPNLFTNVEATVDVHDSLRRLEDQARMHSDHQTRQGN